MTGCTSRPGDGRGQPEQRQVVRRWRPGGEDAAGVRVLQREAELDAEEAEAHVPQLPERQSIEYATPGIVVTITRSPFKIAYAYKGRQLVAEKHGYVRVTDSVATGSKDINKGEARELEAIEFALDGGEALYGAGARAVGMNRRGYRFPLYNKASYGYGDTPSRWATACRWRCRRSVRDPLRQSAGRLPGLRQQQGRQPALRNHRRPQDLPGGCRRRLGPDRGRLHRLTGRQPLPPRWAFGNFASRFGYRDELRRARVVDKFIADDIPLDAIVLDLYWFGKEVKGTMGNLAWDRDSFPHAER
jgi:oligosaccharide 4-alpha-D-glucosyltransferase